MSNLPAIGIDLGTTYSCVGVYQYGKVEIIANEQGNRTTPSFVAFTDTQRLLGDSAKFQLQIDPKHTVFDVKRLMGRKMNDPKIQEDLMSWPFKVVPNEHNQACIQVEFMGQAKTFSPEEISAMILTKMKEIAEIYLGGTVKDAVITVPAYFNDSQRQATKDAGHIAGLNVLRILTEPTAAALAYGLHKGVEGEKIILVYDLGGGTFDVAILRVKGYKFQVMAVAGDSHLGGEDFDLRLVKHFSQEFERKFKMDITKSAKAMRKMRSNVERMKRTLSVNTEAVLEIDSLHEGVDFYTKISRAKFEDLCSDLFRSTIPFLTSAIADAKIDKSKIDDVVLVGGSIRIPKIVQIVQEFFEGKKVNLDINADEAVAYGAAMGAAIISGVSEMKDVVLVDVTPLSLGIKVNNDARMSNVIDRNTAIPCKHSKMFVTKYDFQTTIAVEVFEGEHEFVSGNRFLGQFDLTGLRSAPAGTVQVNVTFDIDNDGILTVTAEDCEKEDNKSSIKIEHFKGRLTKNEVDEMRNNEIEYKTNDDLINDTAVARNKLEALAYNIRKAAEEDNDVTDEKKNTALAEVKKVMDWLEKNPKPKKEDYELKERQLNASCDFIVLKLKTLLLHPD